MEYALLLVGPSQVFGDLPAIEPRPGALPTMSAVIATLSGGGSHSGGNEVWIYSSLEDNLVL